MTVKTIILTKGYTTQVSDEDYSYLRRFSWYASNQGTTTKYYSKGKIGTHLVFMHRAIAQRKGIDISKDIDHKDGNSLNNVRSNLRIATRMQNSSNRHDRTRAKSGVRGVYPSHCRNQRWCARITFNGKLISLGTFDTVKEAARVRKQAEGKYFGKFAPKGR